jgi:hypothetical protein
MIGLTLVALQTRVLAFHFYHPVSSFCDAWEYSNNCAGCTLGTGTPPGWGANGNCDFSAIEDEEERLLTAAAYIDDAWEACAATCDFDYAEWIASWYGQFGSQTHECYWAWQDPYNWFTWEYASGTAGTFSTWNCSCQRFFTGECGE